MTDMALAALKLAMGGHPVLPLHHVLPDMSCSCRRRDCPSPGKHPRTQSGLHDASAEPAHVAGWWRRWKEANVGLLTGANAGLVVVDLDGEEGCGTFLELQRRHGPCPKTRWVRTGSGGWHAYFTHPGGPMGNTARKLGSGIDTRADGGYVVAPPSNHASGARYAWANTEKAAPLPGWLLDLLRPRPTPPRSVRPLIGERGGDSYAHAALRREAESVKTTAPGSRNHVLNCAAFSLGTLIGAGRIDENAVVTTLLDAALAAGLGQTEAERTIASGVRGGLRHPRPIAG